MTATCRLPCCAAPRMTVSELLERGLRRNRAAPLAIQGDDCADAEGCFPDLYKALSGKMPDQVITL